MIKLRRMRWAGHVAHIWEKMNKYRILVGKPEGKRPHISGRMILKLILENQDGVLWTGFIWLRIGIGGGLL
jgi:hypothetical protein